MVGQVPFSEERTDEEPGLLVEREALGEGDGSLSRIHRVFVQVTRFECLSLVPELVLATGVRNSTTVCECRGVPVLLGREILPQVEFVEFCSVELTDDWEPVSFFQVGTRDRHYLVVLTGDEGVCLRGPDRPAGFERELEQVVGSIVSADFFDRLPLDLLVGPE